MAPPLRTVSVQDFSGGPNLRDAQSELAKNECVDSWNVTYDERGGVVARLGYIKRNTTAFTGAGVGAPSNLFESRLLDSVVTQAGTNLYLGTTNTVRKTFTTSARAGFAEFGTLVYAIHPVDGMFSSTDGITWTAVADIDAPKGTCLAVWQNKLWANDSINKARLHWSAAGDGLTWAAADFVDLREKDNEQIVAMRGASGADILARAGLCVFKRRSAYRIYDSATGAYVTIDAKVGAASAISTTSVLGRVYTISEAGIYSTDGNSPMRNESARFEPMWTETQINMGQQDLFAAGSRNNRLYFSLPRAGSTANDLALEYHPEQHWLAPASNAMSCYTTSFSSALKLYGGSPTVSGQTYELYSSGADDGVAITTRFQTRWFELADGFQAMLWRCRLHGRGTFNLTILVDYQQTGGLATGVMIANDATIAYDTGLLYDVGLQYVASFVQSIFDVLTPGVARAFSFKISAATTDTDTAPILLGQGTGQTVGSWALYGLDLSHVSHALA